MTDDTLCIDGTHAHRMRFSTPEGPMVEGICQRGCGRTQTVRASGDFWDTDMPKQTAEQGFGWLNQRRANQRRAEYRNLRGVQV